MTQLQAQIVAAWLKQRGFEVKDPVKRNAGDYVVPVHDPDGLSGTAVFDDETFKAIKASLLAGILERSERADRGGGDDEPERSGSRPGALKIAFDKGGKESFHSEGNLMVSDAPGCFRKKKEG